MTTSVAMGIHVRRTLTKWGNGWGLRLTRKEVQELGAKAGQPVEADLSAMPARNPIDRLPSWNLGSERYDLDDLVDEDIMEDLRHGRR